MQLRSVGIGHPGWKTILAELFFLELRDFSRTPSALYATLLFSCQITDQAVIGYQYIFPWITHASTIPEIIYLLVLDKIKKVF